MGFVGSVGASAAVMSFCRSHISTFVKSVCWSRRHICSAYLDDFPILDFETTSKSAGLTVWAVCKLLGVWCSEETEIDFSERTPLLGVVFDTSSLQHGSCVISNKRDRVEQISLSIDQVLEKGKLLPSDVPRLFGRLQFAEHQIAGRAGRLALAQIHQLARGGNSIVYLDDVWQKALRLLQHRLRDHSPRKVDVLDGSLPVVVFTDGACEENDDGDYEASVRGFLYSRQERPFFFGGKLDPSLVEKWMVPKKHIIGLVELYAVVLARSTWSDHIAGKKVKYFIDSIPTMRALIRGTSFDLDWRKVLLSYEELQYNGSSYARYARVPSKSNIADCPSRNDVGDMVGIERETPRTSMYIHRQTYFVVSEWIGWIYLYTGAIFAGICHHFRWCAILWDFRCTSCFVPCGIRFTFASEGVAWKLACDLSPGPMFKVRFHFKILWLMFVTCIWCFSCLKLYVYIICIILRVTFAYARCSATDVPPLHQWSWWCLPTMFVLEH